MRCARPRSSRTTTTNDDAVFLRGRHDDRTENHEIMHPASRHTRTASVRRLLATAAALLAAACGGDATAPDTPPQSLELSRFPTLEAARANASASARQRVTITDAATWQTFWAGLVPDPRAGGPAASVDFSREMIIAAVMPIQPSAGAALDIEKVTEHADHIEAEVVERTPGPDCVTAAVVTRPFDVVRVARRDKPVRFTERTVVASCAEAPGAIVPGDTLRAPIGKPTDAGNGTRVTLVRVVDDSRCPMNALCIWEGSASVVLRFERAGAATADTTLHTNARMGPTTFAYGGAQYTLFGLTPFRIVGQDAPRPEEYAALIAVKR
jgi:hypothetical protein